MTTTTRPLPWWRTAPNPECASWCTDKHDPKEFTVGGGFSCFLKVADSYTHAVEVQRGVHTNRVENDYQADPAIVWADVRITEMTPNQARKMAADLLEAADIAEATK